MKKWYSPNSEVYIKYTFNTHHVHVTAIKNYYQYINRSLYGKKLSKKDLNYGIELGSRK